MNSKQRWMGIGLVTITGVYGVMPVGSQASVVYASEVKSLPFNEEVVKAYAGTEPLVKKATETKKEEDVVKAYKSFIKISQLFILDDQNVYKEGNDMDKLYEELKKTMYSLPKSLKDKHLPLMADMWVEELKNNQSSIMSFYLDDFLFGNTYAPVQKGFDASIRKLNFYTTMPPDTKLPADWNKDIKDSVKENENAYSKPVLNNPNNHPVAKTPKPEKDANTPKSSSEKTVEFVQEGKVWYEISVVYKDGKIVKKDKRKIEVSEAPHLYQRGGSGDSKTGSSKNTLFPELTDRERAYLTEDQNLESKHTLQYSLDKQGDAPYYFDTGMRVDKDMNASYEQYRDVLYQIAVKSGGHVVEDEGRVLVVIDKRAIIVADKQKSYTETEIESLFESFPNIDIRILETRIGTSTSLEQQLVSKQARSVTIDKKKVDLTSTPIVREERVLLPIKEIVSELGAELEQKGAQFIVTKDKDSIVYELKNQLVVVKGKQVDIGIAPDVKDGVLYVEMSELAKAFGYEITWDGDSSELAFNKK